MKRATRAFTLIELLIVISIVALLMALFVPKIPAALSWYKERLARTMVHQIGVAVDEYKRIYGAYPGDTMMWKSNKAEEVGYLDIGGKAATSLYLMLQGPDGAGWGPTKDEPGIKEFGPAPDSPSFVTTDLSLNVPFFHCPFERPILYYQAKLDSKYEDITTIDHPGDSHVWLETRYQYLVNFAAWDNQRGANDGPTGPTTMDREMGATHWMNALTLSQSGGLRYPYNPKSYLLWTAGPDRRFGYWVWSEQVNGYIADERPNNTSDGIVGFMDDVTNFIRF